MSRASRFAFPLLVVAPLIAAGPAHADATTEAAQALQQQIRAWIADLAGPSVDFGSHAVRVSPAGEAFRFELPVAGPAGAKGWQITGEPVTAMVKPLDGGRWTIESLKLPSPLKVDRAASPDGKPVSWTMEIAGQEVRGLFDPSLATASNFDATLRAYGSFTKTDKATQTTLLDRYSWHGGWMPAGDGRVTVSGSGQGENLNLTAEVPAGPGQVTVTAAAMHSNWRAEGVAFDQLGAVVRSISGLLPAAILAAGSGSPPDSVAPGDRALLRSLVHAVRDLAGGMQTETTVDKLALNAAGVSGTLGSFGIAVRAAATDGMLDASLRLSMDNLDSPLIKGPLRDYLPRRLSLTPSIAGVPASDLMDLLLRAIDSDNPESLLGDLMALIGKGPLKAGLDDVVLDLGAAALKGTGTVTILAADEFEGSAEIVATGLDRLIRSAGTVPELRSAAPVLIFLKGIGEQKGDTVVWKVTYADGQTRVNGTDLGALMAPDEPKTKRPNNRKP